MKAVTEVQKLRSLVDRLPNMIALVDASMQYRLINRAYSEYFGYSKQELIGRHAGEALGQPYFRMVERYLGHALRGKTTTWIINHQSRAIGERLLSIKLLPYPMGGNKTVRNILFVAEDVTETMRLHQKLAAFKEARELRLLKSRQDLDRTLRSTEYHALKLDDSASGNHLGALLKRRVFASRVLDELGRMKLDGGHKAYLIFTIKNYADIISHHGEAAGKAVLDQFATRLATLLHESVQIGQVDKDRVALAIPGTSLETAQAFGNLICREMKNREVKHGGETIVYSVYAGVTGFKPWDADLLDVEAAEDVAGEDRLLLN